MLFFQSHQVFLCPGYLKPSLHWYIESVRDTLPFVISASIILRHPRLYPALNLAGRPKYHDHFHTLSFSRQQYMVHVAFDVSQILRTTITTNMKSRHHRYSHAPSCSWRRRPVQPFSPSMDRSTASKHCGSTSLPRRRVGSPLQTSSRSFRFRRPHTRPANRVSPTGKCCR